MSRELAAVLSVHANQLVIEFQEDWEEALSAAGFADGARLLARLSPGRFSARLFLGPSDIQGRCRLLAVELADFAERVRELSASLQDPPAEVLAEESPETVESSIQGTLQCVLADNLEPAIRSFLEAGGVSREELDRAVDALRDRGLEITEIVGVCGIDPQGPAS